MGKYSKRTMLIFAIVSVALVAGMNMAWAAANTYDAKNSAGMKAILSATGTTDTYNSTDVPIGYVLTSHNR